MLKKYYCYLPAFNDEKVPTEMNPATPTKRVSFVRIPTESESMEAGSSAIVENTISSSMSNNRKSDLDNCTDKTIDLKMSTEIEVKETAWPDIMKFRHYDV